MSNLSGNQKPNPKDYGWEEPTPLDPGGWCIEGGEEAYDAACERWEARDRDIRLAQNLRARHTDKGEVFDYPNEWLSEVACECHLGMADVEQVLNALIYVCEVKNA